MSKGRIITPGDDGPAEPETDEPMLLPKLRTFWVEWFNPSEEKIERVVVEAHELSVGDDGMLIFRAWKVNTFEVAKLGPVVGYYVRGFRQHVSFGEIVDMGSVN